MNPVALIQGRMNSSRLPGKILMDIEGRAMIERVYERAALAESVRQVVILTTTSPADDDVEALCRRNGWPCERGSEEDVLDRYYQAAARFQADPVLRLTGDCPLLDPVILDQCVRQFAKESADYVSYEWPEATFPRGLDVEGARFSVLETAWREAREQPDREHVTRFIYQHPERFRLSGFSHRENLSHLRWTVDAPEDLEFVRAIYRRLEGKSFGWKDVLRLIEEEPELAEMNRGIVQKTSGAHV